MVRCFSCGDELTPMNSMNSPYNLCYKCWYRELQNYQPPVQQPNIAPSYGLFFTFFLVQGWGSEKLEILGFSLPFAFMGLNSYGCTNKVSFDSARRAELNKGRMVSVCNNGPTQVPENQKVIGETKLLFQ